MGRIVYPCGCEFDLPDRPADEVLHAEQLDELPIGIDVDIYNINMECPVTWRLFARGDTKGVFQLESYLGKSWSKKVQPTGIEDIAALVALLRPGCISGSTKITRWLYTKNGRHQGYQKITMRELYNKFQKRHSTKRGLIGISMNEYTNTLEQNEILDVIYNGVKSIYQPLFRIIYRKTSNPQSFYNLNCTLDHPLLVHGKGWIALKDICIGDRVAVINSLQRHKTTQNKNFRDLCFQNYQYRCVLCDWKDGALDVNHIEGNRHTNNHHDNLNFMCPNHHRMYSEGTVTKEEVLSARQQYILPNTNHIIWVEYMGMKYIGEEDVYDISMKSPHHNFIAGNVVVHNCLKAMSGDPPKSMTQRYCDRKHRLEDVTYYHQELEPILSTTYGVLVYQEQAMRIAVVLAGFNEQEADVLRKAIGKKKPEIMAALEKDFVEGCLKVGLVTEEQAKEIFGWIKESQRYSFNKSHAATYGKDSYWTAFCKAHFPTQFYCSWLQGALWKQDKSQEVYEIVNDAKLNSVSMCIPDLRDLRDQCYVRDNKVYFSLGNIKGVGAAALRKIQQSTQEAVMECGKPVDQWNWLDFLIYFAPKISSTTCQALILSGALDYLGRPRNQMLYEYNAWNKLSDKEQGWVRAMYPTPQGMWFGLIDVVRQSAKPKKEGGACHDKRRVAAVQSILYTLEHPPHSLVDTADFIAWHEEQLLGAPITCHKVDACDEAARANATCKDIISGRSGYTVLAVEVTRVKELVTKKGKSPGKKMASLTLADSSCALENVVAFPDVWAEHSAKLYEGNTVLVQGERDRKQGGFIVKKVWQI